MELKTAIIGCGQIAEAHIDELNKIGKAVIVAVCDLEILMAEQVAKRFSVPAYYDDVSKMLETEKPDVVHITTPPHPHLALAEQALAAGCHLFVEKPLTLNYQDSEKLIHLTEAAGKKLTVGYTYYFDPPALKLRELIDRGVLGDPVHIESFYGYNLSGPFGATLLGSGSHWVHTLPGKLFHNNIDHLLNKIVEFIKDDKPSVVAYGYKRRKESHHDIRDEMLDELRLIIGGKDVSAFGTFCSHAQPAGHSLRIYGTNATIDLDFIHRSVMVYSPDKLPSSVGRLLPPFGHGFQYFKNGLINSYRFAKADYHFFSGFNTLLRLFYDSIINDSPPPIDYGDILKINTIMDDIFEQLNRRSDTP